MTETVCYVELATHSPLARLDSISVKELKNTPCILVASDGQKEEERQDATACVKSTSYNLVKEGYKAHVISDCITSYDLKKLDEMFAYYADKGCEVSTLEECMMEKEA